MGGSIGAAALYGGRAALASEINSETAFALEKFGVEKPPTIEEVLKAEPNVKICLVDHQQTTQMNPAIDPDNVVGVIDHHALQSNTIVTDRPIYIDIRPWGSMSTIIAHTFLTHNQRPPKHVAGMLLCAILSDTLNLQGPTTTEWDRLIVAVLSEIAQVDGRFLILSLYVYYSFFAEIIHRHPISGNAAVQGEVERVGWPICSRTCEWRSEGMNIVKTLRDEEILR